MSIRISRITLFPIKSLSPVDVPEAALRENGSLAGDREFAFFGADGPIDGNRLKRIFAVRASYDAAVEQVTLSAPGQAKRTFRLAGDETAIAAWMSDAMREAVTFRRDAEKGFGDDQELTGPTVIAEATLEALGLATEHDRENMHGRLRSNIVLSGMEAYGEDALLTATPGFRKPFAVGDLSIHRAVPCKRCAIPSFDPQTGERDGQFAKKFIAARRASVAANPEMDREIRDGGHFYAALNTEIAASQKGHIHVGDKVTLGALIPDKPTPALNQR